MAIQLKSRQSGMSLVGIVLMGAIVASAIAVLIQLMPVMSEYGSVKSAVKKAALAPSPTEARLIFDKIAAVDGIISIKSSDLDFGMAGEASVIKFAYQREIHLVGPAYLTMKYAGKSN